MQHLPPGLEETSKGANFGPAAFRKIEIRFLPRKTFVSGYGTGLGYAGSLFWMYVALHRGGLISSAASSSSFASLGIFCFVFISVLCVILCGLGEQQLRYDIFKCRHTTHTHTLTYVHICQYVYTQKNTSS